MLATIAVITLAVAFVLAVLFICVHKTRALRVKFEAILWKIGLKVEIERSEQPEPQPPEPEIAVTIQPPEQPPPPELPASPVMKYPPVV